MSPLEFKQLFFTFVLLRFPSVEMNEKFRPLLHFSPSSNWMNDPNGLIFYDDEWHLFFQHYPYAPEPKNIHWGHAVSRDLLHWTELPIAIRPENENVGIWSGTVVVDWENVTGFQTDENIHPMIAIYTWQLRGWQEQHMSYSLDRGRTWKKYEENPILPLNVNVSFPTDNELNASAVVFRDPKVFFHVETDSWILLISVGDEIQFYRSKNLKNWIFSSSFGLNEGSHSGVWECPDLIEFVEERVWILIVSIDRNGVAGGSSTQYFVGKFDGFRFSNMEKRETVLWVDHGPDFYAGITFGNVPQYDGRKLFLSWMNNWIYSREIPLNAKWRGQMSFPREFSVFFDETQNNFRLKQKPSLELFGAKKKFLRFSNRILNSCSENLFDGISAEIFFLNLRLSGVDRRTKFGVKVRKNSSNSIFSEIFFDAEKNRLEIDRSRSTPENFTENFRTRFSVELDEQIFQRKTFQLEILVDRCSIETFLDRGRKTVTTLFFPEPQDDQLELFVEGPNEVRLDFAEILFFS